MRLLDLRFLWADAALDDWVSKKVTKNAVPFILNGGKNVTDATKCKKYLLLKFNRGLLKHLKLESVDGNRISETSRRKRDRRKRRRINWLSRGADF
jgi:hypothetical protein